MFKKRLLCFVMVAEQNLKKLEIQEAIAIAQEARSIGQRLLVNVSVAEQSAEESAQQSAQESAQQSAQESAQDFNGTQTGTQGNRLFWMRTG